MNNSVGVRAIIISQDGVMLVCHNEPVHGRFYIFPGGGVEKGETLFTAVEREVREETGIQVQADRIVYIV